MDSRVPNHLNRAYKARQTCRAARYSIQVAFILVFFSVLVLGLWKILWPILVYPSHTGVPR